MNTVINTNMAAIRTHGVYNRNNTAMNAAMTRVATGLKINSAQDNASGYAITEKMRERIRALDQANQNTQNDTAMMKTAEGALSNTVSILTTLRERAIDASNDSNTDTDRAKIQTEVKELLKQIDTNASVKYNGKTLIDGSKTDSLQTTDTWFLSSNIWKDLTNDDTGMTLNTSLVLSESSLSALAGSKIKISYNVGGAATATTGESATLGSDDTLLSILQGLATNAGGHLTFTGVNGGAELGNDEEGTTLTASSAGLKVQATTAGTAGAITNIKILKSSDSSDITESFGSFSNSIEGANAVTGNALNFRIDEDLDVSVSLKDMSSSGLGIDGIDVSTKAGAKAAVGTIETALETALKQQTKIGAYEQRLGYASDNLTTARENIEASASTIADSDIAKEMTNYMRYAVLSQASQYMLSQASQNAFSVLNLLQA